MKKQIFELKIKVQQLESTIKRHDETINKLEKTNEKLEKTNKKLEKIKASLLLRQAMRNLENIIIEKTMSWSSFIRRKNGVDGFNDFNEYLQLDLSQNNIEKFKKIKDFMGITKDIEQNLNIFRINGNSYGHPAIDNEPLESTINTLKD